VLDDFEAETAFSFSNVDTGAELVFYNYGDLTYESDVITETFDDLAAGTYRFIIGDSASDGICCSFGQGSITLTNNEDGRIIWDHNGKFNYFVEATLEIDESGDVVSSVVEPPEEITNDYGLPLGNYSFAINMNFDNSPEETTISLTHLDSYTYIGEVSGYDYAAGATVFTTFEGLPAGMYKVDVADYGYDGCGSFEIRDGEDQVLFSSDGQFFNYLSVEIPLGMSDEEIEVLRHSG
jgi:hypothetical protein